MDQDWTRQVAADATLKKVREAAKLLREAAEIADSNDFEHIGLNIGVALRYIDVLEGWTP